MQKFILSLLLLSTAAAASAQDFFDEDQEPTKGMFAVSAGLTADGYELDLSLSYWPISSFGLKCAIGTSGELEEIDDWDWLYDDYYYGHDYDYAIRFKFMPSIELRSPSLISANEHNSSLHIFANPGLCLSPGASGSHDPRWFCWQLRGGIELDLDNLVFQCGYGYTNFYLYSGYPVSHYDYHYNPDKKTHSVFLTLGIRF